MSSNLRSDEPALLLAFLMIAYAMSTSCINTVLLNSNLKFELKR